MLWDSFPPSFRPNGPSRVDFGPIYDFLIFRKPNLEQGRGSAWTRHGAQPGPGTGLGLDQGRGLFGDHLGPIWGPILRDPFRGIGRGPGTHFSGIHLGGSVGALGPIWRPKADILEAEGRHYGGRRPTKWGSGGGAPRNQKM